MSPVPAAARVHPTIVSLNPCSDAILDRIAAPGQLLGVSSYSHDPVSSTMGIERARRYPAVGASVEEVARLAPDVVVADVFLPPATGQALRDLGMEVVTIGSIDSVATSEAQVRQLASATRNNAAGESLVHEIEEAIASARPPAGARPVSAIVWESGGIVAGDTTLIADLLHRTGFDNAAAARGLRQADVMPLEAMIANPPQVILATGDTRSNEDRLLSHPALAALPGTRRVHLDATLLWCGGPTIIRAAERLAAIRRALPSTPATAAKAVKPS